MTEKPALLLVAQPSPTLLTLIVASLRELPIEIVKAENAKTALSLARERLPDLLIADDRLAGMDGYALAYALKRMGQERGKDVRVLLLLSQFEEANRERLQYAGIDDTMRKPFERGSLVHRVEGLLFSGKAKPEEKPDFQPESPVAQGQDYKIDDAFLNEKIDERLSKLMNEQLPRLLNQGMLSHLPLLLNQALETTFQPKVDAAIRAVSQEQVAAWMERDGLQALFQERVEAELEALQERGIGELEGSRFQEISARMRESLDLRLDEFFKTKLETYLIEYAEKVVWKLVPTLAEDLVREELDRLLKD